MLMPQEEHVTNACRMWEVYVIASGLPFASCTLDVYTEVHQPDLKVKLIDISPYVRTLGLAVCFAAG